MTEFEVTFPTLLMQLHQLEFDYDDGDGIDFEPYQEFQSAKDTGDWIKAWTGNHDLRGSEYRIFGLRRHSRCADDPSNGSATAAAGVFEVTVVIPLSTAVTSGTGRPSSRSPPLSWLWLQKHRALRQIGWVKMRPQPRALKS